MHPTIGYQFKDVLGPLINEEDADKVRTGDDREHNIGIYSSLSCNIPYKVFARGSKFNEFIVSLKQQLRSYCI